MHITFSYSKRCLKKYLILLQSYEKVAITSQVRANYYDLGLLYSFTPQFWLLLMRGDKITLSAAQRAPVNIF